MEKRVTKAANWIHDTIEYKIYKNGDIGVYGERFRVKRNHLCWSFDGLCSVFKDGNIWIAQSYFADITREADCPYIAAAQIAANTV